MDRASILSYLQAAEMHVAGSEKLIVNQCKLISSLERAGKDTTQATALFRKAEQRQLDYLADRDRLLAELRLVEAIELQRRLGANSERRDPKPRMRRRSRRRPV